MQQLHSSYAHADVEGLCRESGASAAQQVGKKELSLLDSGIKLAAVEDARKRT